MSEHGFIVGDHVELLLNLSREARRERVCGVVEEVDVPPVKGIRVRFDDPDIAGGFCTASAHELTKIASGLGHG